MHTQPELLPAELQVQRREQRGQIGVDLGWGFALSDHRIRILEQMSGYYADDLFVPVNQSILY
jgi:hypothetical protein